MKILIALLIFFAFGVTHLVALSQSELYALKYAPEYHLPPEAMFGVKPEPSSEYSSPMMQREAELKERIYSLRKAADYANYKAKYVYPLMEKFEFKVNIAFYCLYSILFMYVFLTGVSKFIDYCAKIKDDVASLSSSGLNMLGKLNPIKVRKLNAAVKEFESAKILHENGLLSEQDFQKKKSDIRKRMDKLSS
jgi:hypothetical protein